MKRNIFLGAALLLLTASCSNNDTTNEDEKGKVNVAHAVNFTVDFADYNAEQELNVTRAGSKEEKLEQQAVDLGNGIIAMCTLQRDTTQQTKQERQAATRALADDTYTMLAYDAATHAFKGEMTGTVSGGAFTPADAQKRILLEPGTYDFVLFNSKVSRSGNNLTVNRSDAANAMIGRTQQTINSTPKQQQVAFTMKHAGAKVKIKLTGYMSFTGVTATLESVNATDIPASSVYDAANNTWTAGTGAAMTENITYGASQGSTGIDQGKYVANSNEETPFMPSTDVSTLKLTFTAGSIYLQNMANVSLTFSPASTLKLEQNGAYVLNVNLMYSFLYLMNNGDIGTIKDTTFGGGTKTPIGIVVSQSRHLAVALEDAGQNPWTRFGGNDPKNKDRKNNFMDLLALENGYQETWDASASVDNTTVKGLSILYPAFKDAGDYSPTLPTGVSISGTMVGRKWHLPAYGEWKYVFTALGFGNISLVTNWGSHNWYGNMMNVAFRQVNGKSLLNTGYWSSSEYIDAKAPYFYPLLSSVIFGNGSRDGNAVTRAFIKYRD